ncbi:MAG TPA: helix-turn-helix domain-containing protein [Solirubrobacteraceae bacterium]|nr:helix-turn-helix domain-containing protein [Solirubrobacteraceae bacterium]
MPGKRTYADRCGIARALDVMGERWALLVVRELLLGPKRFTDLRAGLPHVSPDVLSQRLRDLDAAGVVARGKLPPPAAAQVYALTDRGAALEPVVLALGRWGSVAPFPPADDATIGPDALVIALKTLFAPGGPTSTDGTYELRMGEHRFHARVDGDRLTVERGGADDPDAVIGAEPPTLAGALWHGRPLDAVAIEGDRRRATRFLRRFPLPDAA